MNKKNTFGLAALHLACLKGHADVAEYLLSLEAEMNEEGIIGTPLHSAAREGHLDVTKCLVRHGADLNRSMKTGATALHIASEKGHADIVECLLSQRGPVHIAATYGETAVLQVIKFCLNQLVVL